MFHFILQIVQIVIDVNMVHITNGLISTLMVFILVSDNY